VRQRRRSRPSVPWWHSIIFVLAIVLVGGTVVRTATQGGGPDPTPTPSTMRFWVTDSATGSPIEGATVSIGGQALLTDSTGAVSLPVGPTEQEMIVQQVGYEPVYGTASSNSPLEQRIALVAQAEPTATEAPPTEVPPTEEPLEKGEDFAGVVLDREGEPIEGAVVRIGKDWVETNEDGEFEIEYNGKTSRAEISASGYADQRVPITADAEVTLQRFSVKGVYLPGPRTADEEVISELIDLIDATELNAVIIDTKDAVIYYDTQIDFFREAGAVTPEYDAVELIERFHDHGIYVIARQVAFKDPLVAEAYESLAVKDEETGEIWRGWAGEAWVNPFREGLVEPNVDLAVESAGLGFDEIQYDYIRFPDGDLGGADFGRNYDDPEKRIGAVTRLLRETREALRPMGVKLSADVFGWMLLVDDDQGIGQRFPDVAAVVDYISPMIYPSHFPEGSIAVDGHPNDFPYETISISLSLGMYKIPGMELKMRPWLQDFSLPGQSKYGADDIRAQIDATEDSGSSGWMVWNIDANYIAGAYDPE
jgi:hypothetical protein